MRIYLFMPRPEDDVVFSVSLARSSVNGSCLSGVDSIEIRPGSELPGVEGVDCALGGVTARIGWISTGTRPDVGVSVLLFC